MLDLNLCARLSLLVALASWVACKPASETPSAAEEGSAAEGAAAESAAATEEAEQPTAEPAASLDDERKFALQFGLESQPCFITRTTERTVAQNVCFPLHYVRTHGRPTRVCTGGPEQQEFVYDERRRVIGTGSRTVEYESDTVGRITQAGGVAEQATFNEHGWLLTAGDTTYTYDAYGRTLTEARPEGTRTYTYDARGGFTVEDTAADGACVAARSTVDGDPRYPNFVRYSGCGPEDPDRVITFERDAFDRVTTATVDLGSDETKDLIYRFEYDCR